MLSAIALRHGSGTALLILFLPALIVLHELGHYWCARWLGIQLTEFSIGLGPALWNWHRCGVHFVVRLWPVAAHLKPAVANVGDRKSDNPRLIQNRPVWQQIAFLAGGAIANILTAYVVLVLRGLVSGGSVGGTLGRAIADLWQLAGMLGGHLMSALFGIGSRTLPLDFYQQLAFLSLTFGLINLLPLHPFDGGRIFVIVLRSFRGPLKS